MKNLSPKEAKSDNGFVIIFSLIILSMMMITGFAFVAETSLAKKSSRGYAQAVIIDELAKGILTTINHNIENTLKVHDSGKLEPTNNENERELISNPEAHSMFHKYMATEGVSSRKEYKDIRVSFLSKEVADSNAGSLTTPALKFYLGEDSDQFFSTPFEYQGYAEKSGSKSNVRTPYFDGIDIHADEDDVDDNVVDGDGDGRVDNTPEWDYRYTYMIMSQIGKIDPNYAIDNSNVVDETIIDDRYKLRKDAADSTKKDLSLPPSYAELTLEGALDGSTIVEDLQIKRPQQVGWASFTALSEAIGLTNGSTDLSNADDAPNYYALYPHSVEEPLPAVRFGLSEGDDNFKFSLSDIELFRMSSAGEVENVNSVTDVNTPLFDSDADGQADVSVMDLVGPNYANLKQAMKLDRVPESGGNKKGIGCLNHEQLSANFIDYFDPDPVATTNGKIMSTSSASPNLSNTFPVDGTDIYCGIEKAPRLNEVYLVFQVKKTVDGTTGAISYSVFFQYNSSNVEMYSPKEFIDPIDLQEGGSDSNGGVPTTNVIINVRMSNSQNKDRTFKMRYRNAPAQGNYYPYTRGMSYFGRSHATFEFTEDEGTTFGIDKLTMALRYGTKIGINSNGLPTDYAYVLEKGVFNNYTIDLSTLGIPDNGTKNIAICFQAQNPLDNNNPVNWKVKGDEPYWFETSIPDIHTVGEANQIDDSGITAESDKEIDYLNITTISSNSFRNNIPESLVELGNIRTGNVGQTLDMLYIPQNTAEMTESHYGFTNLFRLGNGHGMEVNNELPAVSYRRLNANSRFKPVLKSAFFGARKSHLLPEALKAIKASDLGPDDENREYYIYEATNSTDQAKIENLVKRFPGIISKDDETGEVDGEDISDFSSLSDPFDRAPEDMRSIFGRETSLGSNIPDRNPIAYRKPFNDARGNGTNDLQDHEAERLFWETKDLMGGMNYFSIIYSIQPGRGKKTVGEDFKATAGWFSYRAEVAYGLFSTNPSDREKKTIKVLSVRKTK